MSLLHVLQRLLLGAASIAGAVWIFHKVGYLVNDLAEDDLEAIITGLLLLSLTAVLLTVSAVACWTLGGLLMRFFP